MLRTDRPRYSGEFDLGGASTPSPHELLLAVTPTPRSHATPVSTWPEWLIPTYRSGGLRPTVRLLEEER